MKQVLLRQALQHSRTAFSAAQPARAAHSTAFSAILGGRSFGGRIAQQQRRASSALAPRPHVAARAARPTQRALGTAAAAAVVDMPVAFWLIGCGGLVAGMVSVGGITRLTRSGLSMTDWKLTGGLPPTSDDEWHVEFERYKAFPEWQQRKSMTLEEFKFIYWWEYGHRMLGRVVGLAFAAPLAYFGLRGRLPVALQPRLAFMLALGGTQGLVGWWMVRSGLEMDPEQRAEIRVSPYRLATHLGLAFTTYSLLVWTALDVLRANAQQLPVAAARHAARLRPIAVTAAALVGATAFSGAFVAGNDAGRAFNTWPAMHDDGGLVPEGLWTLTPLYRNLFENTATVQFDHRTLAYSTVAAVTALAATARFGGAEQWRALPGAARACVAGGLVLAYGQASLGVVTLLLYVPIPLAAAHQFGSLVLLSTMLGAAHTLRTAAVPTATAVAAKTAALKLPAAVATAAAATAAATAAAL